MTRFVNALARAALLTLSSHDMPTALDVLPAVDVVGTCVINSLVGDSELVCADVGVSEERTLVRFADESYVADFVAGHLVPLCRSGYPVGWLGETVVWRDPTMGLSLLDGQTLLPATRFTVAQLDRPPFDAPSRAVSAMVMLAEQAEKNSEPESNPQRTSLFSFQDKPTTLGVAMSPPRLVDAEECEVMRMSDRPTRLRSPEGRRVIVHVGERTGIANLMTHSWVALPGPCRRWVWLHVFALGAAASRRPVLPRALRDTSLTLLDVSPSGNVLVLAEALAASTANEPAAVARKATLHALALKWGRP